MQFTSLLLALTALTPLASSAPFPKTFNSVSAPVLTKRADGTAFIHNNCGFDITVNPCANGGDEGFTTIPAGTTWSQAQQNFGGTGAGVSLKVNNVNGAASDVAQFEYTINNVMGLIFYDLSLINGNPMGQWAQQLTADGAGSSISCAAGESPCAEAYTWAEQVATQAAPQGSDLHYYVCQS